MTELGMVIVGSGEAGTRAALELRQRWNGPITLIGEERWFPYERPPLSKRILCTEDEPSPVFLIEKDQIFQNGIEFLSGSTVIQIDRQNHELLLMNSKRLRYERLLLATGARPRKLSIEGTDTSHILYLRTFEDAQMLRNRLQPGKHVAVIGGGFIGLEVAASAINRGCYVTVIELGPRILMRGVPEEIAKVIDARHRAAGVEMVLRVGITKLNHSNDSYTITLSDGSVIQCDTVIVGIGAVPETSLAAACGLEIENGIRVNEFLRTSDPDIFGVGDCCSFPHPLYGGKRIRLESWRNAQDQGIHVAGNMLGGHEPYKTVPWFWSDQYELTLQIAGLSDCGDVTVKRDMGDRGEIFFHVTNEGKLAAASGIGPESSIAKDIRLVEMLIQQEVIVTTELLKDSEVRLKSLLHS